MPGDRTTGRGPSAGAAGVPSPSTPERGTPPGEVRYEFVFPITDAMRAATSQRARHALMWAEILRTGVETFGPVLADLPDDKVKGFEKPLRGETGPLFYRIPRHLFLRMATPAALTPTSVLGAEGEVMSSTDAQLHIQAAASYRQVLATLDAPRSEIFRTRVGSALDGFLLETGDSEASFTEALWVSGRIAEKIRRLDDLALQALVDRDPLRRRSRVRMDFSPKTALHQLVAFDNTLDHLLAATHSRARGARVGARSLTEAIAALDGFDTAWTIRARIKALEERDPGGLRNREASFRETRRLSRQAGMPDDLLSQNQSDYLDLLDQYRAALAKAGAVGAGAEGDFEGRLDDFHRTLAAVLMPLGQTALADLVVRVDNALHGGEGYLARLYAELNSFVPKAGDYTGALVQVLEPQLTRLARDFPILGYEKLARDMLDAYGYVRSLKGDTDYPPDRRFAWRAGYHLRGWRVQARRAQDIVGDPEKVWLAEDLVTFALTRADIPTEHFLRDVARAKSRAVSREGDKWTPVLLVISVALLFFPPGLLVVLVSSGLVVYDVASVKARMDDQLTAETLANVGLARDAPSGWWLVLEVVSLGFSLGDVARMLRVSRPQLVEAISNNGVDALLQRQNLDKGDLVAAALGDHLKDLKQSFKGALNQASSVAGAILPLNEEKLADAVGFLIKIGFTRLDEVKVKLRIVLRLPIPDAVVDRAFRAASKRLAVTTDAVPIDQLQGAMKSHPRLKHEVAQLKELVQGREARLHEVTASGDQAALPAAKRKLTVAQRRLASVEHELGRVERLSAVLDARILQLEQHQKALTIALNEVLRLRSLTPTRRGVDPGLRSLPAPEMATLETSQLLEKQSRNVQDRLRTLCRVKAGQALSKEGRALFHEDMVSSWLREKGYVRVEDQVALLVTFTNGRSQRVVVDNLVEMATGQFGVIDAKWSDSFHVGIGTGRGTLTEAQRVVYPALVEGKVASVQLVDPVPRFGRVSGAVIEVDPRVLLVLNNADGTLRFHALR
jgi:hypothetical protein